MDIVSIKTILLLCRYNVSYADTYISYSYRKGSSTSTKSYKYGTAFKEKTTSNQSIACNSYANCYIGCSCQSGWTQGSAPTSGEYVWATDDRYKGVNAMSVSDVGSVTPLSKGVSTQSVNGNNQVVSLDGGVSTMGSSGGITCYKAACSSGYYLDAPNSTYFTYTSTSGTIGLTCYKATGCKSGYYNGGSSYDYHGYKCSKCTYSCPDGYSTGTTSCSSGYILDQETITKDQSACPASTTQCGKCIAKTCSDYGLYSSSQSGKHCSTVSKDPGLTCYDCHTPNYSWCPSGSQIGECGSGYYASDTKPKECTKCSAVSGTCNVCSANTCASEGYVDSCPDGQYGTPVEIDSGTSTKTCYKDCQEGCPDGYYEPSTNSYEWNVVKDFMNLDEKNGCYKPTSCKSGYLAKSDLKSGYDKYFQLDYSADFGGLSCYTGHCKYSTPNTSYFTTSEFDVGGGIKCKYVTGCNYNYSSSPDTSGCINTSPVATSGNIECYEKGPDDAFTVTLVIDHYYNDVTPDYTLYSASVSCPYTTRVAVDISTGTGSYSASDNGGIQCGGSSTLAQVDGIQNGHITSVQPQESSSSLSDCGSFSYNFGPNIGERTYVVKFEYVINDHR